MSAETVRERELRPDERGDAVAAFERVFARFEPWGRPFQSEVPARLLIYETNPWDTNPWGLSDDNLGALLRVADDRDLQRVFVSTVDPCDVRYETQDAHYVLGPLHADSYEQPGGGHWTMVPHALYPASGAWGVISSEAEHVMVAGTDEFITDLSAGLATDQDEMVEQWLGYWSEMQDNDPDGGLRIGDWIPAQLAHIIGPERAERALKASRLRRGDSPA